MKRSLAACLAVLTLSGCGSYVVAGGVYVPEPYPPVEPIPDYPYPPTGGREAFAIAIARSHPRIGSAIDYAQRAYGPYRVRERARWVGANLYDVEIIIESIAPEVYLVRVDTWRQQVVWINTRLPGGAY